MKPEASLERIYRAQRCLRQVLERWDATNLDSVEACQILLEESVTELQDVIGGPANLSLKERDAQGVLLALKCDIARLTRIMDACAAFQRGLWLRSGNADPNYDQHGNGVSAAAGSMPMEGERVALDV